MSALGRTAGGRAAWALALLLAGALLIAACGGDDDGEPGTQEPPATGEASAEDAVVSGAQGNFDPQRIYREVGPGVVTVIAVLGDGEELEVPLGGDAPARGQGSGFVVSDDGEIVTNAHVVSSGAAGGGAPIRPAEEVYVEFADRNRVEAEVVGQDPFADIALLRVDPEGLDLRPLSFADFRRVTVGEPVAAIGSPFGEEQSLSVGVVSATDRTVPSLTRFAIDGVVQTDASINPGNSGGPLLNAGGEVIGVNQQIQTRSGGNDGVGFAVPVDLTQRSIEQIREDGEVTYAFIGVTTQPIYPQLAERLGIDSETQRGALIVEISDGSPAQEAGLRGGDTQIEFQGSEVQAGGDVIVAVEGEPIDGEADLPRIISRTEPGSTVELEIIRDGERQTVDVTLAERSDVEE